MLLHYLGKADQAQYVLKYTENLKKIPNIINRNLNKDYQILIIFGENISDTTGYLIGVLVSTPPSICFCTTWGKQTKHNTC